MKKFKTKNNHKKIITIIIIITILILFITLSFLKINKSYGKVINYFLSDFEKEDKLSLNIVTSNLDYLINSYNFKEETVYRKNSNKIYLYNTHNLEKYNDGTTIIDATKLLNNNLTRLGIEVIQEERKTNEYLHTGLSYYEISKLFIKDMMLKDKDILYYIDIHRDSVTDTTITINNKKYAKIMFVLGLENNNYEKNKEVISKMNNYLNENYPGISRGIYEKKGSGVDGKYNQDLSQNVLLIEIGGIENNREEINNSTEILSLMMYHILGD